MLHPNCSFPSPPSPFLPQINLPPSPLRKEQASQVYINQIWHNILQKYQAHASILSYQGWMRQPSRGKGPHKQTKETETSPASSVRTANSVRQEHIATQPQHIRRGIRSNPSRFPDLCKVHEFQPVDSAGCVLMVSLTHLVSLVLPHLLRRTAQDSKIACSHFSRLVFQSITRVTTLLLVYSPRDTQRDCLVKALRTSNFHTMCRNHYS